MRGIAQGGRTAAAQQLDARVRVVVGYVDPAAALVDAYIHGRYAFMLPTATLVATSCQLAGIGGAALFWPIFLLVFPFLGPQYPLDSAAAALASGLLTKCFGFASWLSGYAHRGLVDALSIPAAVAGALAAQYVASSPVLLQSVYAALMLGLAGYLSRAARRVREECRRDGRGRVAHGPPWRGYLGGSTPVAPARVLHAPAGGGGDVRLRRRVDGPRGGVHAVPDARCGHRGGRVPR